MERGTIVLVQKDPQSHEVPIFDVAEGLKRPYSGKVEFMGRDWQAISEFEAARRRGLIGRVFEAMGWVSNLDVYENIVLAERHHTSRPESNILQEVNELMTTAGFDAIPACRPHLLRRDELRRAQWVRAFLGKPALVLLERPELDVYRDDRRRLVDLVCKSVGEGSAVVWLSPEPGVWHDDRLKEGRRYSVQGSRLIEGAEDA